MISAALPVGAQESCLTLPGLNERCAAWSFQYPQGDPAEDECSDRPAGMVMGDTAVYLTGTTDCYPDADPDRSTWDVLTMAVSFDGSLLWTARHRGNVFFRHQGFGVALSPDGSRLYVAGSEDNGEDDDWIVLAYEAASGEHVWTTRYDGPAGADDQAWVVTASDDGERVYVAGFDRRSKPGGGQDVDTVTASLDAATGEMQWTVRHASEREWIDQPRAIGVEGGRVVVTGSSFAFEGSWPNVAFRQDLVTLAYRDDRDNRRAELVWSDTFDGGDWDQPAIPCVRRRSSLFACGLMGTIAVSGDTAAIVGTSFIEPTTDDAVWTTIAYDLETGERRWLRHRGDPEVQNKANAIGASPDGATIYVTGFENDDLLFDGIGDAVTVAYDAATGEERWNANQALPAVEDAAGFNVAASEDTVFTTGAIEYWMANSLRVDTMVLAYDAADGTREWIARHNRFESQRAGIGGSDGGNWAAVTPDRSRLIVGGDVANVFRLENQADHRDYAALAYDVGSPTPDPTLSPTPTETTSPTESPTPSQTPESEAATVTFTERSEESGQFSDETLFEARLTDSGGEPIQDVELNFELAGAESLRDFTSTTDEEGVASVTPSLEEKPGRYQLTAHFAGDDDHAGDAATVSFVVEKEDSVVELSVHGEDDDKTLRARLSDRDTPSEGIAQRTIDFYSDSELIGSDVTDPDGVAAVALPPRHRGANRTYEVVFESDDFYLGSSDKRAGKGSGQESAPESSQQHVGGGMFLL